MNMTSNKHDKEDDEMDIERDFLLQLKDPDEVEAKKNSPQGQVYRCCLERIGQEIARVEFQLQKLKCHQFYEQIAFQEFLGFPVDEATKKKKVVLEEALEKWNML